MELHQDEHGAPHCIVVSVINTIIALYYERAQSTITPELRTPHYKGQNLWYQWRPFQRGLDSYLLQVYLGFYTELIHPFWKLKLIVTYVISIVFHSRSNSSAFSDGFGLRSIAGVADSWPLHVRLLRMARGDSRFSADGNCSKSTSNLSAFQNTFNINSATCCIDFSSTISYMYLIVC